MNPCLSLEKWLKEHPHANMAHRIFRIDGEKFVSYCGRSFPILEATGYRSGILLCSECQARFKARIQSRSRQLKERYDRRIR
jgi:hypothetical protein